MIIRLSHMAGTTNAAAVTMPGTDRVRGIATSSSGSRPYRVRSAECARAAVASCVSGKRTGCQLTRGLRLRGEHAPRGLQFAKLARSEETQQLDEWEIYVTDEVRDWITALDDLSHRLVVQAIDILADRGPTLGRPLVDHVEHSTVKTSRSCGQGRRAEASFGSCSPSTRGGQRSFWSRATSLGTGGSGTGRRSRGRSSC